ncbi:hypothetical protein Hanom_Chr07g00670611 [Helianthus anomalus]
MSELFNLASQIAATASLTNLLKLTFFNSSIKLSRCSSLICLSFLMTAVLRLMLESNVRNALASGTKNERNFKTKQRSSRDGDYRY